MHSLCLRKKPARQTSASEGAKCLQTSTQNIYQNPNEEHLELLNFGVQMGSGVSNMTRPLAVTFNTACNEMSCLLIILSNFAMNEPERNKTRSSAESDFELHWNPIDRQDQRNSFPTSNKNWMGQNYKLKNTCIYNYMLDTIQRIGSLWKLLSRLCLGSL